MLLIEQVAHKLIILCLRHCDDVSEGMELMIDLTYATSVRAQDLHLTRHLLPY